MLSVRIVSRIIGRFVSGLLISWILLFGREAAAQSTILNPGDRPPHLIELEPHFGLGVFDPPGDGTGGGVGFGFRASFEAIHNGFVPTINDSVSIGIGADFAHYGGNGVAAPGACTLYAPGPAGTNVCVRVSQTGGSSNYLFFPLVMQWNFFLSPAWSVFGEPGLALYSVDDGSSGVVPVFDFGGRFHFNDRVTLTLRLGYPTTLAIGVSIFL
ncbi:MAG: hypothetical protein ABSC94_05820 [Polyangiaceae bacterium]|jgi:hypothetical protein